MFFFLSDVLCDALAAMGFSGTNLHERQGEEANRPLRDANRFSILFFALPYGLGGMGGIVLIFFFLFDFLSIFFLFFFLHYLSSPKRREGVM